MCQTIINQMKKVLKYLIKLILVIVLPLIVSTICISLIMTDCSPYDNVPSGLMWGCIGILIATIFNAFVYYSFMSDTTLLPKYKCDIGPIIGLAISYNNGIHPTLSIVIPFCVFEFELVRDKKK